MISRLPGTSPTRVWAHALFPSTLTPTYGAMFGSFQPFPIDKIFLLKLPSIRISNCADIRNRFEFATQNHFIRIMWIIKIIRMQIILDPMSIFKSDLDYFLLYVDLKIFHRIDGPVQMMMSRLPLLLKDDLLRLDVWCRENRLQLNIKKCHITFYS